MKIKNRIIFVCHGNICRSPMAEFVLKDMVKKRGGEFHIESAATSTEEIGNDIHYGTKLKLRREGIPFERRAARQLTRRDYDDFDLIIGMDRYNISNILRITGGDPDGKVKKLLDFTERRGEDIDDPWYTGDFDTAYRDIYEGCRGLLDSICGR